MIRTSFAGTSEDVGDSNISPTSVMDFGPSLLKCGSNSNNTNSNKRTGNEIIIQQLKRRMTFLEHEKANMEKDLMNQLNTVVFDKETIVGTLQEKMAEFERRYKEERQSHAETKSSFRQQRFSSAGDTKLEVFRLQDRVSEITDERNTLESQVEQLKSEKIRTSQSTQRLHERIREITEAKKDLQHELDQLMTENEESSQSFLSQLTCMEESHKAEMDALKKEQADLINEFEQSKIACMADMERDLFEKYQTKMKEMEQAKDAEITTLKAKLSQDEQGMNRSLKPPASSEDEDMQSEIMSLVNKLSRAEADNMNLRDSLEKQKETSKALQSSLEDNQQKTSDYVTIFEEERATQKEKMDSLTRELDQERSANESLQESLQALQVSYDELSKSSSNEEAERENLVKQVEDLRQQLEQRQVANESLKASITDLESTNSDLCASQQEAQETVSRLELQLEEMQSVQHEKASLQELVNDLEEQVEEGNSAIEMLKESLTDLETDNSELQSSLQYRDSTIDRLQDENESLRSSCSEQDSLRDQLQTLKTQSEESESAKTELKASISNLEGSKSKLQSALESKDATISRLEEEKDKVFTRNQDLLEMIDVARHRESTLHTTVKEQQESISDLKTSLRERKEAVESLEGQVQELQDQLEQEQTQVASLMDSLGEETNEKSVLYETQLDLDGKLKTLENQKQSLRDEMEDLKEELQHGKDTIANLKLSLQKEEADNSKLLFAKRSLNKNIEELNEQLQRQRESIGALQASLKKEESEKNDLIQRKESLNDEILRLQENNDALMDGLETMKQQYAKDKEAARSTQFLVEEKESALEEQRLANVDKLYAWQKQCLIYQLQAKVVQHRVDSAEASQAKLQSLTEKQKQTIEDYEKNKKEFGVSNQRDRLSLLERIGNLKEALEEEQKAIVLVRASRDEYKQAYSEMSASVIAKDEKLSQQEKSLALLQDKAHQLDEALRKIEGLEADKKSLVDPLEAKEKASVGEAKTITTTDDESISSIDGDQGVSTPEAKVEQLEASVQRLKEENEELRNSLEEYDDIQRSIEVLVGKKKDLLSEIDELYSQLQEKQKDQPDSTVSLEEDQMCSIMKATMDDQEAKDDTIKELKVEVEKLQTQLEEAEDAKAWLEKSLDEVEELRENMTRTAGSLEEAEQKNKYYGEKVEELESELFEAKKAAEIAEEEIERLQDLLSQAEASLAASKEESEADKTAKEEIERLKSAIEQAQIKRMDREAKLKVAYKREVGQYKERIEAFEKQLLQEKAVLQKELEAARMGKSGQSDEVIRLRAELSATKQALEAADLEKTSLKRRMEDFEAARMEKLLLEIKERKEWESMEAELTKAKRNFKDSKEEILKLRATIETLERNLKSSLERAQACETSSVSKDECKKQAQVELENFYKEKLRGLEERQASLQTELEEKERELDHFNSYFRNNEKSHDRSREDVEAELKQLHEKTIIQARMIHAWQQKCEGLEQKKTDLFEAKRKEIMRDHSEINTLRKENTRLREKVNSVTSERRALQEQLESLAQSIGTSVGRFTSPSSASSK